MPRLYKNDTFNLKIHFYFLYALLMRKGHGDFTTTNVDHLADLVDMHNSSILKERHCYTDRGDLAATVS